MEINIKMLVLMIMLTFIFVTPEASTTNSPEMLVANRCKKYIAENEGLKLKLYFCSEGIATIGYGRNLVNTGISKEEARLMLENDIEKAIAVLYAVFTVDEINSWPQNVQVVMVDIIFTLGECGFKQFEEMITAIKNKNFRLAAKELLDSLYARQLPNRAAKNARIFFDTQEGINWQQEEIK